MKICREIILKKFGVSEIGKCGSYGVLVAIFLLSATFSVGWWRRELQGTL